MNPETGKKQKILILKQLLWCAMQCV